jgi:hypothetical protein
VFELDIIILYIVYLLTFLYLLLELYVVIIANSFSVYFIASRVTPSCRFRVRLGGLQILVEIVTPEQLLS